ncbi:uncharacterized protein LOC130799377 [Amaranthus tricolor]|uniref:uncharacterized protein LOC130799377 n=1 Tax=Amaranthus tricolor TaxID=29722 RepID=UPI0025893739|nr:uncharacterized protein LOC130799377 [Amaranthus tricolor]
MADENQNTNQQLISVAQMEQMFQYFQQLNKQTNSTNEPQTTDLRVAEKLTYHNYTKWCKLIQIAIEGRGRLSHIIDVPPEPTTSNYIQWKQRDSIVLSWIIANIDSDLVNQFLDYTTAWELWKGIETLLSSGRDELQIFDLNSKAANLKQDNDTIEVYYGKLNTLWKEIDRRMPNPMKCSADTTTFNSFIQRQRLYQFLAGINDNLDAERRQLLNQDPLPTIEMAYAMIRRELARCGIMSTTSSLGGNPSEIGKGLAIRGQSETLLRRDNGDRTYLKCTHCGGSKHTKEGCFKLIGYPKCHRQTPTENIINVQKPTGNASGKKDYSEQPRNQEIGEESKRDSNSEEETRSTEKDGGRERKGGESLSLNTPFYREPRVKPNPYPARIKKPKPTHLTDPHNKPVPILPNPKGLFCEKENTCTWIFYCGATDTMTYDPSDLISQTHTPRHKIHTANGDFVNVTKAGSVAISPSLQLNNCLLIPKLTHKLLSISQLTKELHCTVLMTSTGCTVQDAQTGAIIGRGTERGGLYYVDEAGHKGHTSLARRSSNHQLRMWHRRLGHPSVGYLKRLFPSLRSCNNSLDCESCVLAKIHKHSYFPSLSRTHEPFKLLHSDVWGPAPGFNSQGFSYFVIFIDDCTRMSWLYFLKHKSEVFDVFVTFYNMIFTQFHTHPQILRSDNGGEYGENRSEDPSWLISPSRIDPKEQVGYTTDTASETLERLTLQFTPAPEHPDSPESPEVMGNTSDNMMVDNEDTEFSVEINNDQGVEMSNGYELPPRKTRGVPPKRYDPEYEAKRS